MPDRNTTHGPAKRQLAEDRKRPDTAKPGKDYDHIPGLEPAAPRPESAEPPTFMIDEEQFKLLLEGPKGTFLPGGVIQSTPAGLTKREFLQKFTLQRLSAGNNLDHIFEDHTDLVDLAVAHWEKIEEECK